MTPPQGKGSSGRASTAAHGTLGCFLGRMVALLAAPQQAEAVLRGLPTATEQARARAPRACPQLRSLSTSQMCLLSTEEGCVDRLLRLLGSAKHPESAGTGLQGGVTFRPRLTDPGSGDVWRAALSITLLAEAALASWRMLLAMQASLPGAPGQRHTLQGARGDGGGATASGDGDGPKAAVPQRPPPAAVSAAALEELKQLQVLHCIAPPGSHHGKQEHRSTASACKACPLPCGVWKLPCEEASVQHWPPAGRRALPLHRGVALKRLLSSLPDLLPDLCPCPAACSRAATAGGAAAAAAGGGAAQALGPRCDVRRAAGGPGRAAG